MTVSFKNQEEIQAFAELLTSVYPSDIIIDMGDLADGELSEGRAKDFHLSVGFSEPEQPRLGMSSDEIHAYLAGEQEALFNLVRIGKLSLFDVSRYLHKTHGEVSHSYDIWYNANGHREMWPV